jgi:hypothetical protein
MVASRSRGLLQAIKDLVQWDDEKPLLTSCLEFHQDNQQSVSASEVQNKNNLDIQHYLRTWYKHKNMSL